jgi:Beta-lactamase/Retinal pigment epithelial membrane protein
MRETSVPGCSVALIRDAKIYRRRGFGVRDMETRQPVDNDTVFEAASASQPVFAYVVMKLAEKGGIDLDGGRTDLVILAAQDFAGEPVARIHLPVRVPRGFHGSWIADS